MQFIKISLLSILIFFIGMFVIVFGNINNSNDYQKNNVAEHLLSVDSPQPKNPVAGDIVSNEDAVVTFGQNDFFSPKNGGGVVTLTASWTITDNFYPNPELKIIMYDYEGDFDPKNPENFVILNDTNNQDNITIDGQDSPDLTFKKVDDIISLNITINGNENLSTVLDYEFEENHKYKFYLKIWSPYDGGVQEIAFTTPSKSVIDFTDNAGSVAPLEGGISVDIDVSWEQTNKDSQIADELYEIDENVQLWLTVWGREGTPFPLDPSDSIINPQGPGLFTPNETYSSDGEKWTISGTYFDGLEDINFVKDIDEFHTRSSVVITPDNDKTVVTTSSIFLTMDITIDEPIYLNTKFYNNGIKIDDDQVTFVEAEDQQVGFEVVGSGYVTYEISGLDYNTEYNLSVSMMNEEAKKFQKGFESITTLDKYPWVTPLDIAFLVIILVEIIAVSSIYILLQRNQKQ